MSTRTCAHCSQEVPEGRSVCPSCGTLLASTSPAPAYTVPAVPAAPASPASPASQPTGPPAPSPVPPVDPAAHPTAMRPPGSTASPRSASQRRGRGRDAVGCIVPALLLVACIGAIVAGYLAYRNHSADTRQAKADELSHTGSERYAVRSGTIRFSLYDKVESVYRIGSLGVSDRVDPASIQTGGWRVSQDGWTEQVAIFTIPPSRYGTAQQFVDATANDLAANLTGLSSLTRTPVPDIAGQQPARVYTADVNTPLGIFVASAGENRFHTRLMIIRLQDNVHVAAMQLTWSDGHEPPSDEADLLRRSLRG